MLMTTLIIIPAAAAFLVSLAARIEERLLYWLTAAASLIPYLLVLQAWPNFVYPEAAESLAALSETRDWLPAVGVSYSLRLDGLNLPFLTLLTLIGVAANLVPPEEGETIRKRGALLLLWEAALIGTFLAQDYILFLLFWAISTVPVYFLMNAEQDGSRPSAAQSFALASLLSVACLGSGLLILSSALGTASVAAEELAGTVATSLTPDLQWWVFLAVFVGCGLRAPIFPLHIWLRATLEQLPTGAKILLVGGFLPLGFYGLLRFAFAVLTDAAAAFTVVAAAAGAVNLLFGSLAALGGDNRRQKTAYLAMTYTGIALLGTSTLTVDGITGAVLAAVSLGLAVAFSLSISCPKAEYIWSERTLVLYGLEAAQHLRLPGFVGFIGLFWVFKEVFLRLCPLSFALLTALFLTAVDHARSLSTAVEGRASGKANEENRLSSPGPAATLTVGAKAAAALLLGGSIFLGVKPDPILEIVTAAVRGLMPFLQ